MPRPLLLTGALSLRVVEAKCARTRLPPQSQRSYPLRGLPTPPNGATRYNMSSPAVPSYWRQACRELGHSDTVMRRLISEYPDARFGSRGSAFETLLRAIVGQQISVKAAQSVWDRFAAKALDISPERILAMRAQTLRSCGLSSQKVTYIRDLASHFSSGRLRPRGFHAKTDQELLELLCDVRGIGQWTAEMFLIFHLNRPDVYPTQDIGLIRAIEKNYRGGTPISKPELISFGEQWRPWRTVATWYLWRSLDPFPVEY